MASARASTGIFVSAAAICRVSPIDALSPPGGCREPLERATWRERGVPAGVVRVSLALSRRGPESPDALAAALWAGRLQLPAPGRPWRTPVPAPGHLPAVEARGRAESRA